MLEKQIQFQLLGQLPYFLEEKERAIREAETVRNIDTMMNAK